MTYEIFNPWVVRSIDSFNFLCCPECVFRSKEKSSFQSHAIENHPKSKVFFSSKQRETQKTGNNLFYCCPECVYKSEDVSMFQIHALENHPSTSMAFFSKHDTDDNENTDKGNPWKKDSVEEFCFYCCTLCPLKSKESTNFENHVAEVHSKIEKSVNHHAIDLSEIKSEVNDEYYEEMDYENDIYGTGFTDQKNVMLYPEIEMKVDPLTTEDDNFFAKIVKKEAETNVKKKVRLVKLGNEVPQIPTCSICSQVFDTKKELKMHNCDNTNDKIFSCSICAMVFPRQKTLAIHNRTIHKNIPCDVCGIILDNPAKLKTHKRQKHPTPQKCEICGTDQMNLKRHINNIHSITKRFKCDQPNCSFSTTQNYNLDAHKKICQVSKKKEDYICKICRKIFPSSHLLFESQYIKHYKAEHNDIPPEFKDKEQYLCSECPEVYFNKNKFNAHVWKKHTVTSAKSNKQNLLKKIECSKCQITVIGRKNYVAHCKDVHGEIISRVETIECHSCDEKFKAANFYIHHHQSVHGNLPPEYMGKKLFVCDKCPQVFITNQALLMHTWKVHNTENKLKRKDGKKCPYCEKRFQGDGNYLEHVKAKHEKNTPFKCDECDRSYGTNRKLVSHKEMVHRRVKCELCGKEICNSFLLKRHKSSVHGITPMDAYQCEKCTSFFRTQTSLDKHVNSKHNY